MDGLEHPQHVGLSRAVTVNEDRPVGPRRVHKPGGHRPERALDGHVIEWHPEPLHGVLGEREAVHADGVAGREHALEELEGSNYMLAVDLADLAHLPVTAVGGNYSQSSRNLPEAIFVRLRSRIDRDQAVPERADAQIVGVRRRSCGKGFVFQSVRVEPGEPDRAERRGAD